MEKDESPGYGGRKKRVDFTNGMEESVGVERCSAQEAKGFLWCFTEPAV